MKILVIRNDRLGDFLLTLPTFALLKTRWPEAHITALVPAYTAPIARLCPWIDELLIDEPEKNAWFLAKQLHQHHFDILLTLFSTRRVALAGCLARIPFRLAPATKLFQFCYNHRIIQRRSRSEKPEFAYNLDLAYALLSSQGKLEPGKTEPNGKDWLPSELQRPLLHFEDSQSRQAFCEKYRLSVERPLFFMHPGSGGSANNLSPEQYALLANLLGQEYKINIVITAGPGEEATAERVLQAINLDSVAVYPSSHGLKEFAHTLQLADLFISGSTGPLHLASALDRPTAAFYPRHRSGSPLRWQTLNAPDKQLIFTPPADAGEKDVASIDVTEAAQVIAQHFLS
jgi:ADP-heptose:LPS heptosyltransferase